MGLWKLKCSGDLRIFKVLGIRLEFPQSNENRVVWMNLKKKWGWKFEQRIEGNEEWVMGTFEGRKFQPEDIPNEKSPERTMSRCLKMDEEADIEKWCLSNKWRGQRAVKRSKSYYSMGGNDMVAGICHCRKLQGCWLLFSRKCSAKSCCNKLPILYYSYP